MVSKFSNKKVESIEDILRSLDLAPPWVETRGPKRKYFFHTMKKGEIIKKPVPLKYARSIQVSMKQAANKQGIDVSIQNHGRFLLIRRNK
jgi:hypothetical protein